MRLLNRIAEKFRWNSFQRTWLRTLIITSLLPLGIAFILVIHVTAQDSLARQRESFENQVNDIRAVLDVQVEGILLANKTIMSSLSQYLIPHEGASRSTQLREYTNLRDALSTFESVYRIDRIRVFSDSLPFLSRGDGINFFTMDDLTPLQEAHPELAVHPRIDTPTFVLLSGQQIRSKSTTLFKSTSGDTLSFYGCFYDMDGNIVGAYLYDYIAEGFLSSLQSNFENTDIQLLDSSGTLISRTGASMEASVGRDHLFVRRQVISPMGWELEVRTRQEALGVRNALSLIYLVVILLAFILAVGLSLVMSRKTIRRLRRYLTAVESVPMEENAGNAAQPDQLFRLIESRRNPDEIDQIMTSFCALMQDNMRLIGEGNRHALEIERYKFKVLQEQINPHFLYNALETIRLCIMLNRKQDALNTLNALSRFYRIALSKGRDTITLREELEMVENYLNIENTGYDGMLRWTIDAGEECLDITIPKFLLQPLVENSIIHSRVANSSQLELALSAHTLNGSLEIVVQDNGIGIDPDTLEQLRQSLASEDMPKGKNGFGMNNVNRRIKLFYGAAYGLSIESEQGCTRNIIRLPYKLPES